MNYNSKLEQDITLYDASGGVPGWCNESRVTCMKNYEGGFATIRCQLHDHARQYDNDDACHDERKVESCIAIYLRMAMEMP